MKSSTAESINLYCKLKKTQEKWWGERGREKTCPNVSASNKKSEMFSLNDPAGSFWIKKYQKKDAIRPNKHTVNFQYLFIYA